jgi:hypothetical protein
MVQMYNEKNYVNLKKIIYIYIYIYWILYIVIL